MTVAAESGHDERLVSLMAAMADDDSGALFEFIGVYRGELERTVRSMLGSLSRRDVGARRTDVDFLVLSAAIVLFDRAGRWRPDGAVPWVWAYRAIRGEVVRWLGHPRVEFVADYHAPSGASGRRSAGDIDFDRLAEESEDVARWLADVRLVAGERDERVHIEYQTQKLLGDPSPANTVAAQFDLQPANVRQIDARIRRRLRALSPTGGLPW